MKKVQALVLAGISLISVAAHSASCCSTSDVGSRGGALTLTLGGGYDYFSSKRQIKNSGIPYIGLGFDFTKHWGIEGILGSFNTTFENSVHDNREINGTLFAVDGVYHFSSYHRIEPYVLAGVGVLGLNPTINDANNQGNINAGVGLQFFVDKLVAFRIEARDFYTIVGGKNDVFLNGGITFLFDMC